MKKKTIHNELRNKLDEIDSGLEEKTNCVLPSKINPDGPGAPPPMHIPLSTAIRVLQERERKESEMNQMNGHHSTVQTSPVKKTNTPPQSTNGTLRRDGSLPVSSPLPGGEKLMLSHGKRNFTVGNTPKKITIRNEKLVPKANLLGGEGKMSSSLKKLIAADEQNVVEPPPQIKSPAPEIKSPISPQIKSPIPHSSPNDQFRQKHLRSPEAIEISNTLKRLISQEKIETIPFKADVALPEDHQLSDQLKRLILEDMQKEVHLPRSSTPSTPSTLSQSSSISSMPDVDRKPTMIAKPIMRHPIKSTQSPPVKNGSLIDSSIRIPLPPRVPSPPPQENPKKLNTQLSCDRLNKEFQEFNAYRVANPPSPKKIAIPLDPNGSPNFEQKTVVSFSQELASAPNRYLDTVKVMKTVQNGNGEAEFKKLGMNNIKFIIDPENNESVVQVSN